MQEAEKLKWDLAAAYRILALMGMDNLTYTHLSARLPGTDSFYINPFEQLYAEVTPQSLLHVTLEGRVIQGTKEYNPTGYAIHSAIYKKRPDINAIFHLHTTAGVAVSAMECGLLPISQFALHFYDRISYQDYDSQILNPEEEGNILSQTLGETNKAMILRNHGTITCGSTIAETFFYTQHLEEACKVQCMTLGCQKSPVIPEEHICKKACEDLLAFEENLGERDWQAVVRYYRIKELFTDLYRNYS